MIYLTYTGFVIVQLLPGNNIIEGSHILQRALQIHGRANTSSNAHKHTDSYVHPCEHAYAKCTCALINHANKIYLVSHEMIQAHFLSYRYGLHVVREFKFCNEDREHIGKLNRQLSYIHVLSTEYHLCYST